MNRPIDPGTRVGHVHLKVADLERALGFYCGVLGFELTQRYGHDAAFISAGGYHHHIGLLGEPRRPAASAGHHRPVPPSDPLSESGRPGGRATATDRCGHPTGRRQRPWGQRGPLFA